MNGLRSCAVLLLFALMAPATAQTMVNAGFEGGTTGWSSCPLEINPANVYGGSGTSNVAEVDGDNDPNSTADDKLLCQTITGFTIGAVYTIAFDAARRQGGPTPTTVSVNVQIDNALNATVTRTGAWNMVRETLMFTATATTHNLRITPNFTVSYGMLFDNFGVTMVSALPVELLYFDAEVDGPGVLLSWATASEHNSASFAVERSTDGTQWSTIATLPAAGNSLIRMDYTVRDQQPLQGLAYYRLDQVDLDGTENRTAAKALYYGAHGEPLLWPNPATTEVHIGPRTAGQVAVEVYNSFGQRLPIAVEQGAGTLRLVVGELPNGTYMVRKQGTGEIIGRFLKQ